MTNILYQLNAISSPSDPRDYQAESIFPPDINLPNIFDPRKNLLPIRNQGSQGSCLAESTACLKELQEKLNINFLDYMSPQFIYNNRSDQKISGMYSRDAMDILYKKGIVPEEDYPYGFIQTPDEIAQNILIEAQNYKVKGYAYVNTIQIAKTAIYRTGACIITVPVYHHGLRMWSPEKIGDPVIGGHAMTLIGWNTEGFIIRNSWGDQWGDKGYTIFPYSDWGMQAEIWTLIDDDSSKPDPRYSKWYWKSWRAVKNCFKNFGLGKTLFYGSIFLVSIFSGLTNHIWWIASGVLITGFIIYNVINKLYLIKDIKN